MNPGKPPFIIDFEPDYARFKAVGMMDMERAMELLEAMREAFEKQSHITRCVVDFRDAELRMSEYERFEIALRTVAVLAGRRLATVVKMEKVPNRLYENATNNRGLENLVTGDMESALRWLLA
jgi:hypothetical protein